MELPKKTRSEHLREALLRVHEFFDAHPGGSFAPSDIGYKIGTHPSTVSQLLRREGSGFKKCDEFYWVKVGPPSEAALNHIIAIERSPGERASSIKESNKKAAIKAREACAADLEAEADRYEWAADEAVKGDVLGAEYLHRTYLFKAATLRQAAEMLRQNGKANDTI